MNEKNIATVALRDGGFPDLEAILREAAAGVEAAASQGADLAVLPETINLLLSHAADVPLHELALDDWRSGSAILWETAAQHGIALVLPLLVHDKDALANRFYVLSRDGTELGFYQKQVPAKGERLAGVVPVATEPIPWEGLRLGGGICIDTYFPDQVFEPQMEAGADLFVIPSMTPAGPFLDTCAIDYGVPFVLAYSPWSRILDRDARELAAGGFRSETVRARFGFAVQLATVNFDAVSLFADFNQDKMREVERRYGKRVRIRFDQSSCIFVLESRSPDLEVKEIMSQFGLVSRRDYFAHLDPRSYSHRRTPELL